MMKDLSRRQFGKAVAIGVGSAVLPSSVVAQDTSNAPDEDIRVRLIEQSRGKGFTAEQRAAVLKNIRNTDKQWAEGRKYLVPDTTEPALVFTPTPLSSRRAPR